MEGAGECLIIVKDVNEPGHQRHRSYNKEVLSILLMILNNFPKGTYGQISRNKIDFPYEADFTHSKLSRASQTNHNMCVQQKTNRSAQAQSLYDCPSNIYRTPAFKTTDYYTEFPPQKKFNPLSRERSPTSSLVDPFAVSLRQYSSERHNGSSAHLLRKLLIYTQSRSSPKSFNIRSLRTAIRKSQSGHKEKLLNKKPQRKSKDKKDTLENIYRSNSCKNIARETSMKPAPIENKTGAQNIPQKEESKVRNAKVGAGTKRPKLDLSTTYDYLQNSSCSLYLPRGILDRNMEVRYLDDVTRCVKDTIKMLCESEKDEPCPKIASRYMQHLLEYHHRDAQAQATFERKTEGLKSGKKNWSHSLIDFDGMSPCDASRSCRQEPKKCHFEPTCGFGPVCYFPDTKDNDEQVFPDGSVGGIVQEWMRGIPINANFSPTDRILRDRITVELTNNLSAIITEPKFEDKARKVIFNYLTDLPMWLPKGEAQIQFKNQIVDFLIYRLTNISYVIGELKSELFRWVKNVDYEPRYDDGEIVTDSKIVNIMAERLEPLIINRAENESLHKSNLHREIFDELLHIPLDVRDEFKCKIVHNLADDLASRLLWLNAKSGVTRNRSEDLSIRNIINDWMENIPVNPFFSQINLELREQLADDLANKLTKLRNNPDFETLGKDAIIFFLNNLPMWWPGDDNKDFFINELANKLIYKLPTTDFSVDVENVVSGWARNIQTDNVDDLMLRVLAKILPIILNRQRLIEESYKSELERSICEELRNTCIDFRGQSKSIVIDSLAENLTDKLIGLDKLENGMRRKIIQSKSDEGQPKTEYDEIYSIVNDWVRTLPVNHDFSMKEKQITDQMARDLAKKIITIKNNENIESKVKEASLQFLKSIPIWTPHDNDKDKFLNNISNKLCDEILSYCSREEELKRIISKWAEKVTYRPCYEDGNTFNKTDITPKILQKVKPVVLNHSDMDGDYNNLLKKAISEQLRKFPLEVKPEDKNYVISELAKDLANDLLSFRYESTTSQKIEPKRDSNFMNDIVIKWLNDIPVKSDFKLEDDKLRKELGQKLISKLTKLADDPKKLRESSMEVKVKKAAEDCLHDLPMWKPGPGKEEKYNNELVTKLLENLKNTFGSVTQSQESKSDRSQSVSNAEGKISNEVKSNSKRESRASDSGKKKSIESKNKKRQESSAADSDKEKSSNSSENKRKSTDSKSDKRYKSKTSSSGRIKSSDSSGDRSKSGDTKRERRKKSSASDISKKKSTNSSGDRKLRKYKRKSGDSGTRKGHQSDSSGVDKGKSSESSGDRRKSRASDTGRNKSGDKNRGKSISNDSYDRKSRDSKRRRSNISDENTVNLPRRESKSREPTSDISSSPKRPSKQDSAQRKFSNSKSKLIVSSEPSEDGMAEKKVFDILKDNSMFAHLSPMEETHVVKNITDEVNKLPGKVDSVEIKHFIDEAVSEWIDVLDKKATERHFTDYIIKCFKAVPEIVKALDKKNNQNLVHKLAIRLTDYKANHYNKKDEEKIKEEVKSVVLNVFNNENIAAKKQSVEIISQAIMNIMQQVQKDRNNLKQILETEILQWMHSIPEIFDATSKNEHKRTLKKLVYDIQMLAARKTTDSVVTNRIQEKITLFLDTVLQKENVVIEPNLMKKLTTKLLNHIIFLIKQNNKNTESVNTLKTELSFWLVDVPLLRNALCLGPEVNIKKIFHILLGLDRNRVNDKENSVKNVVSEFITETIEKSCGSISARTKSILTSELLHELYPKEQNKNKENEKKILKLSGCDPGLSNKLDILKLLIEEVIKNHISSQTGFHKCWAKKTEGDEILYHDLTHDFAEILENKFLMIFGSRKDDINDISEYLQALILQKGSPVDHAVVADLIRELMADVSVNLGNKRNQILKHLLTDTSKNLKERNECSPSLKGGNDDYIKYSIVTSEDEETTSKKNKTCSNPTFIKERCSEMNRIYNLLHSLYETYDKDHDGTENKSGNKEREESKKPMSPCTYSALVKGTAKGNMKNLHPPSTSQSSEDMTNNTYSLRKHISKKRTRHTRFPNIPRGKSTSPIHSIASSQHSLDDSPVDDENIFSVVKRNLYKSPMNDPSVFNVVPCITRPCTSKAATEVRGSNTRLYHTTIKGTSEPPSLLRNRSPFKKKKDESYRKRSCEIFEHFEDESRSIATIANNISKNIPSLKSVTDRKGITEILVKRVGLSYKEAGKFADLLIEKTNSINKTNSGIINKSKDSIIRNVRYEIQDVFRSFHIDHMLEETEVSILNILINQVIVGDVDEKVRTSLIHILGELDGNIAAKVADSLLDHVNKISCTIPLKPPKIKPTMAQHKRKSRQQYLTALSVEDKSSFNFEEKSSEDKQKYLEVRKNIVDFVKERILSPTSSVTEIIDTATDDLLRIYMGSKENKEISIEELESVVRREIKNFLLIVPIETDESKNDLIDEITNKLHDVDSIIRSSSGETTTSTISRNLSIVWTHEQQEAFLRETKKLLNDILEHNDINISHAKHLALELDDELREIISSKKLNAVEKLEQINKEFLQYFRNLPSLSSTNITPDDLAKQVIDNIPNIIKLATCVPNQKDFNKEIVDFIRAKTGGMTPISLQQLQAQVEEIMAATRSILDGSDMTPNEKSETIKLGFSRLISGIPKQTSETAEKLASELYDKIFGHSGPKPTTPSPSLTSSNEEVMIIRNNETRYLNMLMNIIRNWTDQVPLIRDEISDTNLKDNMARDLAKDITDRQKYIQLNTGVKTSDVDELEYLKYQVFRWLNRTLDVNDLSPFVNDIEGLMEQIRRVPVCPLVKPSNKVLEDEIAKWVQQVPCNRLNNVGNTRQIKELADKIQRHRGKPRADSKIERDIVQFIPNIFREDETTLKALGMQLKTFLKNQGLLRGSNARNYKTGAEDLYELVEDWCRDLPIYLGDSPEEQERTKTSKQNINSKLINKIGEMNMNPQILNDDFLYEDLLLDEVDKLLSKVPRNPELEKYLPALKRDLISRVKGARKKIRDEQAGHAYIQQLRDTIAISASMPEALYPDEINYFEILRENLVDAFIKLHFVTDNNEDEIKLKRRISDEISRFCNDYLRRHPCTPIDPKLLSRQLYCALQLIPIPKDESLRSEIEELKIKEILFEWVKEISLKEETGSELLQRHKTIAVLAKRLREIEKEKESNINFDSEGSVREEITKWLRKNPLKVGQETEVPKAVDKIVEKLKKPEHVLDISKSYADDCSCPSVKPTIPACTLSSEDKAHLKRIREKYNSPCVTGKSCLTTDSCSQTIEPQTWCPNKKTQDRYPMFLSKQSSFPYPSIISSASPYEIHQYPNVNVKNYIWDSMDSKMSSIHTPRMPCQSEIPYCMPKQMSTQQPLPECNSVSSQVCPQYEQVICPRSSAFKCSQSCQARPKADIPCSTPKPKGFIDSQDSGEEDCSSEDYNCSPCRPTINSGVCRICRPSGALYSSFLPRKSKKKRKKKRSSDECEFSRFPNRLETCGQERPKPPCSCRERNSKKGDKLFCYRASKNVQDECLGHSETECPHPSYMYFRN